MTFPEHLLKLRIGNNLLQKDIAKELGIALQTYQRYENGYREPTLSTLIALADFYKISVDVLICREQAEFLTVSSVANTGDSGSIYMNGYSEYRDEFQEELINGEVVIMSPAFTNHNRINRNILLIFVNYLDEKIGEPFGYGEAVYLTETDHFIPDFMVVCDPEKVKDDGIHGAPDLVVEVLSPSTAHNDRGRKMEVYGKCGIREYWIVSPNEKSVEQYVQKDGRLTLLGVHSVRPDFIWKRLSEEEKAAITTEFQCSLFDDLTIHLEDIFKRVK